ncbi:tetratricopeptide repeat protein [Pseudopontixanthobacter vadosimaris]|uniref:tetratricopeptide repeat protein n=1 Tax=Pseudopontixanthobacter vadosimaris TaxID=2726450 RepID=UPI00147379DE|nr:tetratricopeptide repeat protein [Pseudopontixanthobacter vadosimaris]
MNPRLAALLAALLLAQPALAQPALVQSRGEEREAAQEAYGAGYFAEAEAILRRLLEKAPADADLLRRLANVQAAQGDLAGAQETIDRALALAPADLDVQLARANILAWRGRTGDARAQADAIALAQPDYPGLADAQNFIARQQQARSIRLFSAGIGAGISRVEFPGGSGDTWTMASGAIAASLTPAVRAVLEVEHERRALSDTRLALRADMLRQTSGSLFISGSVTPSPDFRESWSVGVGGEEALGTQSTLLLDGRYAAYRGDDVFVARLGVRQTLGKSLALSARTINLFRR